MMLLRAMLVCQRRLLVSLSLECIFLVAQCLIVVVVVVVAAVVKM